MRRDTWSCAVGELSRSNCCPALCRVQYTSPVSDADGFMRRERTNDTSRSEYNQFMMSGGNASAWRLQVWLLARQHLWWFWGLSKMHFWDENVYLLNAEYIFCGKRDIWRSIAALLCFRFCFAGAFRFWHSDYAPRLLLPC